MKRDVLSDANSNWVACLEVVTDHVEGGQARRFGTVAAASAGVPIPLFNQVFVFQPPEPAEMAAAVRWISGRELPFWVTVPESLVDDLREFADGAGLVLSEGATPGMALTQLDDRPDQSSCAEIVPVSDASQLEDVASVTAEAFGLPLDSARALVPASMLEDPRIRWFVGYVDGGAVACGQLLRTGHVAGVYAIAVRETFRRRGLGEAVSWQVLRAGSEAGCSVGVLQASPMGQPVYRRMGFNEIVRYRHFAPEV